MLTYMGIFAASLLLTLIGIPPARRLAMRIGLVDAPAARKVHRVPVPLMGGVAMWLASLAALFVFTGEYNLPQLGLILLGGTLISLTGLVDDRFDLSPYLKLVAQFAAAGILIYAGVSVQSPTPWDAVNIAITVIWVVGITNALNLLDNMDGLAAGIAAIASGFFLVLAAGSGQYLVASLAAAIAGTCLAFLRFNFLAPARIFMGDAGSLFLGYLLAVLGVKIRFDNDPMVTWLVPILVLAIPIFDTTLITISRLRRGLNPLTAAGKDHTSHRLILAGLSNREAVMVIYLLAGIGGLAAVFLSSAGRTEAYVIGAVLLVSSVYGVVRLEGIFRRAKPAQPVQAEEAPPASSMVRTAAPSSPERP